MAFKEKEEAYWREKLRSNEVCVSVGDMDEL